MKTTAAQTAAIAAALLIAHGWNLQGIAFLLSRSPGRVQLDKKTVAKAPKTVHSNEEAVAMLESFGWSAQAIARDLLSKPSRRWLLKA